MAFREVPVFEVREILRLWLMGKGYREIARLTGVDRKTVRRYVEAAVENDLVREGGEDQLTDGLIGIVCEAVRPARPDNHGASWAVIIAHHDDVKGWLDSGLTLVKTHELLERKGVVVPYRTLHRYVVEVCDFGTKNQTTVRVNDGEPGGELQVDFGKMGLISDPATGRNRVCQALIFTPNYSRYSFVWLTFSQAIDAVIEGFEAAWSFFGGVFAVVIPDNMKTVVIEADACEPRLNQAFVEYAQSRGFVVDPARVRSPKDKPRVERTVPFVRNSFFAGETFIDLADAQRRVEDWCRNRAGMRIHGTTQQRPAEVFATDEAPKLLPAPNERYDVPIYKTAKVHKDHHIEVAKALYSIPGNLIGETVDVRADSKLVKVFCKGQLVKVQPRTAAGGRVTDPDDLPAERTAYAMRDIESLKKVATRHGTSIGEFTTALLDHPLPWTKMRQVYRLMGFVRRYGAERVDAACGRAIEAEAIDVGLIGRMLERATENDVKPPPLLQSNIITGRFSRDASEFATIKNATVKNGGAK